MFGLECRLCHFLIIDPGEITQPVSSARIIVSLVIEARVEFELTKVPSTDLGT